MLWFRKFFHPYFDTSHTYSLCVRVKTISLEKMYEAKTVKEIKNRSLLLLLCIVNFPKKNSNLSHSILYQHFIFVHSTTTTSPHTTYTIIIYRSFIRLFLICWLPLNHSSPYAPSLKKMYFRYPHLRNKFRIFRETI